MVVYYFEFFRGTLLKFKIIALFLRMLNNSGSAAYRARLSESFFFGVRGVFSYRAVILFMDRSRGSGIGDRYS